MELYKTGIIPQAEQSLESATIGYRVNKVDFLTLLDSRMTLFNYEREFYESHGRLPDEAGAAGGAGGEGIVREPLCTLLHKSSA